MASDYTGRSGRPDPSPSAVRGRQAAAAPQCGDPKAPDVHRRVAALDRELAHGPPLRLGRRQTRLGRCFGGDEELSCGGSLTKPMHHIHRVSDGAEPGHLRGRTDEPGVRRPGVHADPDREATPRGSDGRRHPARGIVSLRERREEQRHDPVPQELVDDRRPRPGRHLSPSHRTPGAAAKTPPRSLLGDAVEPRTSANRTVIDTSAPPGVFARSAETGVAQLRIPRRTAESQPRDDRAERVRVRRVAERASMLPRQPAEEPRERGEFRAWSGRLARSPSAPRRALPGSELGAGWDIGPEASSPVAGWHPTGRLLRCALRSGRGAAW